MERVWLNVIGHKTNDLKVLTPLLLVGYVPCVDVDCHPIRQYVLVMFQKYTQGTPVTLFFISHLYYQNRLKAKDRMSEQYRCKSCGYVFDMKDMMCSECGNGYFELQRWTKGGDGSHWEGCEEVHWDCRIAHLEKELARLQEKLHDEMSQLEIATDLGNKRWVALNDIYENGEKHNTNWCKRKAQEGLGIK